MAKLTRRERSAINKARFRAKRGGASASPRLNSWGHPLTLHDWQKPWLQKLKDAWHAGNEGEWRYWKIMCSSRSVLVPLKYLEAPR